MAKETFDTIYMRMPNSITKALLKKRYAMRFQGDDNVYLTPIGDDRVEELLAQWLKVK